jgi:hypothetical protein
MLKDLFVWEALFESAVGGPIGAGDWWVGCAEACGTGFEEGTVALDVA